MDYTTLTLGSLMSHKDANIRRQAIAIFKHLPEANAKLGKAYMEDSKTRANDKDREQADDNAGLSLLSIG